MPVVDGADGPVDQTSWWQGLHKQWEETPLLRDRMRKGMHLLIPHPLCRADDKPSPDFVERSVHNCRQNKDVLIPAMKRWADNGRDTVPSIDCLYREVELFFQVCHREDLTPGDTHMDCWTLRKLMTLVKSLLSKNNPPTDEIMAEIFLAFGYEISVEDQLAPDEEPEVPQPAPEEVIDQPEEQSESEDEIAEDAVLEDSQLLQDSDRLVGEELPKHAPIADKEPLSIGRPVATPQFRACEPPEVEVPAAPIATESYENLGSMSSLCAALDELKLRASEEEPIDGEPINICSDDDDEIPEGLNVETEAQRLQSRLQELQALHAVALEQRAKASMPGSPPPPAIDLEAAPAPNDPAPEVPEAALNLTGSVMDTAETQVDLQVVPETEPAPAKETDPLLAALPDVSCWDGVSRRDQHLMVASRKEAKANKKKGTTDKPNKKLKRKSSRRMKMLKKAKRTKRTKVTEEAGPEAPEPERIVPEPTSKAKAKAKSHAKPKASPKATPKRTPKAKSCPMKSAPKPKASPKSSSNPKPSKRKAAEMEPTAPTEPSAPASKGRGRGRGGGKGRGKGGDKPRPADAVDAASAAAARPDKSKVAILSRYLKQFGNMPYEATGLDLHKRKFDKVVTLNTYWNRPACGVKLKREGEKATEVAYFSKASCPTSTIATHLQLAIWVVEA
ncbi:unnamed protein product [Symbiodinium sp. CCMP2592]|nr:unnamed protein product [Symbiodinium sp. CCMP2592]